MSASIFVEKYLNLPAFQLGETTELTMAIIQQVACQRVLPHCLSGQYQNILKKYVTAKSITENKLISEVWLATLTENIDKGYVNDFIGFTRQRCFALIR